MRIKDIKEGVKVGKLTAVRPWGLNKGGDKRWLFRCNCGNYLPAMVYSIGKDTSSCGHCGTHVDDFPDHQKGSIYRNLYGTWSGMRGRCYNTNNHKYPNYGGRGIKVCDEWNNSYSTFKKWALDNGWKPNLTQADQSLDRIDVDGCYCPENCRWVDSFTQARNKTNNIIIIFEEKPTALTELSARYDIPLETLKARYKKGLRDKKLVQQYKPNKRKTYEVCGVEATADELAIRFNSTPDAIRARIYRGTIQELFDKEER